MINDCPTMDVICNELDSYLHSIICSYLPLLCKNLTIFNDSQKEDALLIATLSQCLIKTVTVNYMWNMKPLSLAKQYPFMRYSSLFLAAHYPNNGLGGCRRVIKFTTYCAITSDYSKILYNPPASHLCYTGSVQCNIDLSQSQRC